MNQSDLPNLSSIKSSGEYNFNCIGSVILESISISSFPFRYPKSQIKGYSNEWRWLLRIHLQSHFNRFVFVFYQYTDVNAIEEYIAIESKYLCIEKHKIDINEYSISIDRMEIPYLSDLMNSTILDLSPFQNIHLFSCGSCSFQVIDQFIIDGLNKLESLVFGKNSFSVSSKASKRCSFKLTNCVNLTSLVVGDSSFDYYSVMELNNLPNLQLIVIGEWDFHRAHNINYIGNSSWLKWLN